MSFVLTVENNTTIISIRTCTWCIELVLLHGWSISTFGLSSYNLTPSYNFDQL
ncbi:hypothetical protein Hanom_Chr16g01448231 [Helianthus anomalus]